MVSMSEFLSGFEHQGQSVIQQGPIDPSRRREGLPELGSFGLNQEQGAGIGPKPVQSNYSNHEAYLNALTTWNKKNEAALAAGDGGGYGVTPGGNFRPDPSDFVFGGPEIFARLLQTAELDGGFLSDAAQNAQFAGETSGLMGQLGSASRDRSRGAAAANLNPIFAERQNINAQYDALSGILGRRAGLKSELAERQFGAQGGFASMLAGTDVAEKQFKVNTQAALSGAQIGAQGAIAGGKAAGSGASQAGLYSAVGSIIGAVI